MTTSEKIDRCLDLVSEEVSEIENIWEKYYRSYRKFDLIDDKIMEYNKKFEENNCKIESWAAKKAISTHSPKWTGWRRSIDSDAQYCMRWYGGYVYCIEFLSEDPIISEELKDFWK